MIGEEQKRRKKNSGEKKNFQGMKSKKMRPDYPQQGIGIKIQLGIEKRERKRIQRKEKGNFYSPWKEEEHLKKFISQTNSEPSKKRRKMAKRKSPEELGPQG